MPFTIEDATQSGGSVMIEDPEFVRIFGKIISTVEHSEIDDEDELIIFYCGLFSVCGKNIFIASITILAVVP